jgi:hypothetical protein
MVCLSLTIHLRRLGAVMLGCRRRAAWPWSRRKPGRSSATRRHRRPDGTPAASACPQERARAVNSGQPWHLPYRLWLTIRLGPVPPSPADGASQARDDRVPWSVLGPRGTENQRCSTGTNGHGRHARMAAHTASTAPASTSEAALGRVRTPQPPPWNAAHPPAGSPGGQRAPRTLGCISGSLQVGDRVTAPRLPRAPGRPCQRRER